MKFRPLKIFLIFLLIVSIPAYAFAPAVVVGAIWRVGAVVSGVRTAVRLIQNYGLKTGAFHIDSQGRVVSNALAIPDGSKNGVQLDLVTDFPAIRDQISRNPSAYPGISNSLINDSTSSGDIPVIGPDSSADSIPELAPGSTFFNPDSLTLCTVRTAYCDVPTSCGPSGDIRFYSSCSFRANNGCGYNPNGCREGTSPGIYTVNGTPLNLGNIDFSQFTDEQFKSAMAANNQNIAETVQAQGDVYRGLHGVESSAYPATSSPAHYTYAGTSIGANAQDIIETVKAVDDAQAGTIGQPVEQPDIEGKTITTVVQGAATVTTAADGTRVVSIPTTTTVVDAVTGKVISESTSVQTITYAPGAVIPADIQAQIDAASESTTTTEETETEKSPPALSTPEIASINLEPLLNAGAVLSGKFPISMISDITDFIDDLAASPVRPDFDLNLGNDMIIHVSFEWADQFASLFRAILGAAFIVLCVYEAIRLWV